MARYTQSLGIDKPLAMLRGNTMSYYQADGLGSVTSLSDSKGNLVSTYEYDSFGNPLASTGSISNPFRYTGREFDAETGLYFYRARYYDPSIGRFISEDPIRFDAGTNFYTYVLNNPVMFIDPLGLCGVDGKNNSMNGNWRMQGWDRIFNVYCRCYWLFVPHQSSVIWGGNYRTLPSTPGTMIYQGGGLESGDTCLCPKPPKPGP